MVAARAMSVYPFAVYDTPSPVHLSVLSRWSS